MSTNNSHSYLIQIREKIDKNFKHQLKIPELVKFSGISKSKLERDFCVEFGTTIQDYQIMARITVAKRILEDSETPVKVIAILVGYKFTGNFCRVFKKVTGFSPLQYRLAFMAKR